MSPLVEEWKIVPDEPIERKRVLYLEDYSNIQDVGDVTLISTTTYKNSKENQNISDHDKLEISTPIALFTTAYARILMSEYKMKYQDNLYYSDTDSLVLDCKLPDKEVGTGLGKFKLEYTIDEGVFITPKVYALNLVDGTQILKIKGLKKTVNSTIPADNRISLSDLKSLLSNNPEFSNKIKLENNKWYRDMKNEEIKIIDSFYSLSLNENKRSLITDVDGNIINTLPFNISTSKDL